MTMTLYSKRKQLNNITLLHTVGLLNVQTVSVILRRITPREDGILEEVKCHGTPRALLLLEKMTVFV